MSPLGIPEILSVIFSFCLETPCNIMVVCRLWEAVMAPLVWKEVTRIEALFLLFAPFSEPIQMRTKEFPTWVMLHSYILI